MKVNTSPVVVFRLSHEIGWIYDFETKNTLVTLVGNLSGKGTAYLVSFGTCSTIKPSEQVGTGRYCVVMDPFFP